METTEYAKLAQFEREYWWYRAQRESVINTVRSLLLGRNARLLDAGCGTGFNLNLLSRICGVESYGCDLSPHAAAFWNGAQSGRCSRATVNDLPYADNSFDVAVSIDVLCCEEVLPETSIRELYRVLVDGGYLVLLVPAYEWLLSKHDAAVHCVRRFNRDSIKRLIKTTSLSITELTHLYPAFFPMIVATRLLRKLGDSEPVSDLKTLPRWLNNILYAASRIDRRLTNVLPLPFGSTLLVVARKECK